MLSTIFKAAIAASCLLLQVVSANPAPSPTVASQSGTPTYTGPVGALASVGCFSTPEPMSDQGAYIYQTDGNCQKVCTGLGKAVLGLVNGTNCWCGDLLPPSNSQVDNSSCDTPCAGYDKASCGGDNFWWVELTGITRNKVGNLDPSLLSSPSSSPTTQTSTSQLGPSTVLVTATNAIQASTPSGSESKPNTVGIAVGVVVGVVAIAAIIAGVIFYLRYRRRRDVEEEYKRQASVTQFVNSGHKSNSSTNDSRLDPELVRRDSTGSIADNQDYSRRILKVRNPDDF